MIKNSGEAADNNKKDKKLPTARGNFSHCGKLCDQGFYLSGHISVKYPESKQQ